jgi:glycosyltransferase involved in cell wall biosynthesis
MNHAVLSVIVPVFNERKTVEGVICALLAMGGDLEVIVVDDGSTDGTSNYLTTISNGVKLLRHPVNLGKGAAIRTALTHVTGDVVAIHDADLEYDPSDLPRLAAYITSCEADVVYGTRFHPGAVNTGIFHRWGNGLISLACRLVLGIALTDVETCHKVMRGDLARKLSASLKENRFGIEIELTCRLATLKARFKEVPISYQPRTILEGKKIRWRDGIGALWCVARYGVWKRSGGGWWAFKEPLHCRTN